MNPIMKTSSLFLTGLTLCLGVGCYGGSPEDLANPHPATPDTNTEAPANARGVTRPPEERPGAEVMSTAQALTVTCSPPNSTSIAHGGDLFEADYEAVLGCACGGNRVRNTYNVWNTGNGGCSGVRWESTDPRDCRVRVHIHRSGGWVWGTCNVSVDALDPTDLSCNGRCGGRAPSGCYCDAVCGRYGDCCGDVARFCAAPNSCVGRCGESAPAGCFCDAECVRAGDCCPDATTVCRLP